MIFKLGDKEIEVLFLQQHHYDLLNFNGLDLSQLAVLPANKGVTDEDCLDWLSFQRAVEKQYCGFKSTVYTASSDKLSVDNLKLRNGVVFKAKYDEVLNTDRSVNLGQHFYYHMFNGKLYILNTVNPVNINMFKSAQGNLASSLYSALLSEFSIFEFYFRTNNDLDKTVAERRYIDPGYVILKAMS